jgi:hypothetical protein
VVDTVPENNVTALPVLQIMPSPPVVDLGVAPTWSAPAVTHGLPITLNIPVVNNGPSTATSATVATIFNFAGVISIRSATTTQGNCSIQLNNIVVCNVGPLIRNAQKQINIVVVPSSAGQLSAQVQISGTEQDRDSSNDSGSLAVTVN